METKVVEGRDMRWKVLEGAWVMGTRGSEFRCYTECNILSRCAIRSLFWHKRTEYGSLMCVLRLILK